jgi:hypothetical protein
MTKIVDYPLEIKVDVIVIYVKTSKTKYSQKRIGLWILYRPYFRGISADIKLQVYNVMCCLPYFNI